MASPDAAAPVVLPLVALRDAPLVVAPVVAPVLPVVEEASREAPADPVVDPVLLVGPDVPIAPDVPVDPVARVVDCEPVALLDVPPVVPWACTTPTASATANATADNAPDALMFMCNLLLKG